MSIWFKEYSLEEINEMCRGNMLQHLDIKFNGIGSNFLQATMPVDHRTVQPMGLLHGGASLALAESLGSMGSTLCLNPETHYCVGIEINANHLKAVRQGIVSGVARPLHLGSRTHVWEIKISNEHNKLICISRLTLAIIKKTES
jgi:1,4-dihydroxy-2-naphthoyl-CoA hydrolase